MYLNNCIPKENGTCQIVVRTHDDINSQSRDRYVRGGGSFFERDSYVLETAMCIGQLCLGDSYAQGTVIVPGRGFSVLLTGLSDSLRILCMEME